MSFHIILYQPEIPPNTGNVVRLAANTGATLHLIQPLGFRTDDKALRRAGLDYAEFAAVQIHKDLPACRDELAGSRLFALTTRGDTCYGTPAFRPGDAFLFGPESRGLPAELLAELPSERRLRLPMLPGNRSINLSNTVAVVIFEAWRQNSVVGGR